jgi:hypothetical protein
MLNSRFLVFSWPIERNSEEELAEPPAVTFPLPSVVLERFNDENNHCSTMFWSFPGQSIVIYKQSYYSRVVLYCKGQIILKV